MLATAVDPRTKDLFTIPTDEHDAITAILVDAATDEWMKYKEIPSAAIESSNVSVPQAIAFPTSTVFDAFVNRPCGGSSATLPVSSPNARELIRSSVLTEVQFFQKEDILRIYEEHSNKTQWNCPLSWWRVRESKYPKLAWLARRVLAIPATSAPSERLFSRAGLIITEKRNSLSGDSAALLIYLYHAFEIVEQIEKEEKQKLAAVRVINTVT